MTCYIKLCAKIEGMDGLCLLVCVGINHEGVEEKSRILFLLIWIDENAGVVEAVRLGRHSELFE